MKIVKEMIIFEKFPHEPDLESKIRKMFRQTLSEVKKAINSMYYPENNRENKLFFLNPQKRGSDEHPNGVKPIKDQFTISLFGLGWKTEKPFFLQSIYNKEIGGPGPIDYIKELSIKKYDIPSIFTIEWETGNVSSSHRAINKMIMGMLFGNILGAILIVPTREFAKYLTDRIGNYEELEPYFPLWEEYARNERLTSGFLCILGIEYDELNNAVPYIIKGQDGRATKIRPNLRELKEIAKFKGIKRYSSKSSSELINELEEMEKKQIELIWIDFKKQRNLKLNNFK